MANRNGGKTQNFGIKNGLDALFKGCEIATVGAIQTQAEKCYRYTQKLFEPEPLNKYLIEALMKRTLVRTIDGHTSEIQILAGTKSGVNSPHPEKANLDEVELMDWEVLQEAMSMPKSSARARASLCITSTRKYSYGPMQKLLDTASDKGFKVYQWCIWEVIEPCPDWRSGTKKVPYTFVPDGEKNPITIHVNDKCPQCPLVEVCRGKAKLSDGYYSIDDTIDKFRNLDRDTWDAQWECKKPGREGLIYSEFSDQIHIIDSWKWRPDLTTIAGQDFGYNNPAHTVYFQILANDDIIIFDEDFHMKTSTPTLIHRYWKPKFYRYRIKEWWSDPRGSDQIDQMKSAGLPAKPSRDAGDVDAGISTIRDFLKSHDGRPRLFVTKNCKHLISDFDTYHYLPDSDKPAKDEGDHGLDALRYGVHSVFGGKSKRRQFGAKSL